MNRIETTNLLGIDGIGTAEEVTGESYKEDAYTAALGLAAHLHLSSLKKAVLKSQKDTYWGISFDDALQVLKEIGFKEYYSEVFKKEENSYSDIYKIFVHSELGLLLDIESYWGGSSCNSIQMWFNWSPNENFKTLSATSGSFASTKQADFKKRELLYLKKDTLEIDNDIIIPPSLQWNSQKESWEDFSKREKTSKRAIKNKELAQTHRVVWVGNKDCREGLVNFINEGLETGVFLKKWVESYSCIGLSNYSESYGFLSDGHYKEKLNNIPLEIRQNLGI